MKNIEYTSVADAYEEAGRRLGNKSLQTAASQYIGNVWPAGFEDTPREPVAIFAPYLARGTQMELEFLRVAQEANLPTVIATYRELAFTTTNADLVDCYRPPLALPKGQQTRQWVVPPEQRPGPIGQASTVYPDVDIITYWENVRGATLDAAGVIPERQIVDVGGWYAYQAERFGWDGGPAKSPFYYMALMALYASGRAVLFDVPAKEFDDRVILPAVRAAQATLGVIPVIVDALTPVKKDWADVSFLDANQTDQLLTQGRIAT